jgi:hypothetical protein
VFLGDKLTLGLDPVVLPIVIVNNVKGCLQFNVPKNCPRLCYSIEHEVFCLIRLSYMAGEPFSMPSSTMGVIQEHLGRDPDVVPYASRDSKR